MGDLRPLGILPQQYYVVLDSILLRYDCSYTRNLFHFSRLFPGRWSLNLRVKFDEITDTPVGLWQVTSQLSHRPCFYLLLITGIPHAFLPKMLDP